MHSGPCAPTRENWRAHAQQRAPAGLQKVTVSGKPGVIRRVDTHEIEISRSGLHDGSELAPDLRRIQVAGEHPGKGVFDDTCTRLLDSGDDVHSRRFKRAM